MAETINNNNKGIMLAKSVQKHAGRAKEKILQNLGKVDRTADEIFDDHLNNFNRQQNNANRLQKEFNNYIRCIRAAQVASKSLMDAVCEIYEPQWSGYDALQAQTAASDSLWQDFAHKLADQVLIPLNTYTGQFPEMKKKVDKRNRKLIDYDGQRHSFQNLQANANKRKDDAKLTKGREQLEEARRTYEILNTELHDELPALYDSRILFLVTNLQTLFATEQVFHSETAKIYSELEAIVDKLATESQRGSNTLRKQTTNAIKSSSPVQSPVKQLNNANINNSNYQNQITTNGASNANSPTSTTSSQILQQQQEQDAQQLQAIEVNTSRPDSLSSVSSTPESTPENQKSNNKAAATTTTVAAVATATSSVPTTPNSPTASPTAAANKIPSYQDLSAVVKEEIAAVTTITTTTAAATTKDIELNNSKPNANNEQEHEHDEIANDAAMNNVAKVDNSTSTTKTTTTITTTTTHVAKKAAKATPQLNGNEHVENDAIDVNIGDGLQNKDATTAAAAAAETASDLAATTTPSKVNNGNDVVEDNNQKNAAAVTSGDASTTDLPPGVLYRVKATYGYVKEDVDELSFEIGDIIRVIEYDDPEDQEEGWLMGQKEGTNEKGLFPANFTRPI